MITVKEIRADFLSELDNVLSRITKKKTRSLHNSLDNSEIRALDEGERQLMQLRSLLRNNPDPATVPNERCEG